MNTITRRDVLKGLAGMLAGAAAPFPILETVAEGKHSVQVSAAETPTCHFRIYVSGYPEIRLLASEIVLANVYDAGQLRQYPSELTLCRAAGPNLAMKLLYTELSRIDNDLKLYVEVHANSKDPEDVTGTFVYDRPVMIAISDIIHGNGFALADRIHFLCRRAPKLVSGAGFGIEDA